MPKMKIETRGACKFQPEPNLFPMLGSGFADIHYIICLNTCKDANINYDFS